MCLNHANFTFNVCHVLALAKCQVPMKVVCLPFPATVGQRGKNLTKGSLVKKREKNRFKFNDVK